MFLNLINDRTESPRQSERTFLSSSCILMGQKNTVCASCNLELKDQEIERLPCRHIYHSSCVPQSKVCVLGADPTKLQGANRLPSTVTPSSSLVSSSTSTSSISPHEKKDQ